MKTTTKNTIEFLEEGQYELPIGYRDSSGVLHKTFTLREMTGEMEQALYNKKIRRNASKMASELVYQVLETLGSLSREEITREMVNSLYVSDIDYIILMNFKENIDDFIETVEKCPDCGEINEVKIDPEKIPVNFLPSDEEPIIEVKYDKKVKVRDDVYTDSLKFGMLDNRGRTITLGKNTDNQHEAMISILALTSVPSEGVSSLSFEDLQKMPSKTRRQIEKVITDVKLGLESTTKVNCVECDFPIPVSFSTVSLMGN